MDKLLQDVERQALIRRTMNSRTPEEIQDTKRAIENWAQLHPEDTGITELYHQLANVEDRL